MTVLDTNYILRYLLDDNHEMFLEAKHLIDSQPCLILTEVIAEVVYVLRGVYKASKRDIVQSLNSFIQMDSLSMNEPKEIVLVALHIYESKNLDFVDCYLCAMSEKYKIATFDNKLMKCIG